MKFENLPLNSLEMLNITGREIFWERGFFGEGVPVAVVDSGVAKGHPEFDYDRVRFHSAIDGNNDPGFHGTLVASSIVGKRVGVAPKATLHSIEITDADDEPYLSNIAKGIRKGVDLGAKVICVSYSHYATYGGLKEAIDYAEENNVVVVCSAGNTGKEESLYPAAFPTTISVGALDYDMKECKFSTSNTHVDTCQLGKNVPVAYYKGGYILADGTSSATPLVAGIITLIIEQYYKRSGKWPSTSYIRDTVRYLLTKDVGIQGYDKKTGYGICSLQTEKCIQKFHIGNSTMLYNGRAVALDCSPIIVNNRTFLPIRYCTQTGAILWIPESQEVRIMK